MSNKIIACLAMMMAFSGMGDVFADEPVSQGKTISSALSESVAKMTAVTFLPQSQAESRSEPSVKIPAQASTLAQEDTETQSGPPPMQLLKRAALDRDCDGIADEGYEQTSISPGDGECLVWSMTVENNSEQTFCNIEVTDGAPVEFARLDIQPFILEQPEPGAGSCSVDGNSFTCSVGNTLDMNDDGVMETSCLKPNENAEIRYSIRMHDAAPAPGE